MFNLSGVFRLFKSILKIFFKLVIGWLGKYEIGQWIKIV